MFAPEADARPKTDIVVLLNGDVITGEIKGLEQGRMSLKTDAMDTVSIKWTDVASVTSAYDFQVELKSGLRYFGAFDTPVASGTLVVTGRDFTVELVKQDVVKITPIERSFISRIDGSLSVGFSFTKSSEILQLTLSGDATHKTRKNRVTLSAETIVTVRQDEDAKERDDYGLIYKRLLKRRWFLQTSVSAQRNDELGIERRIIAGAAAGRILLQSHRVQVSSSLGGIVNREWTAGTGPNDLNGEGHVVLDALVFVYHRPKTDFHAKVDTFPSMTTPGRVRVEFNTRLRQEIVKDFFVNLSGFVSFDNQPPSVEANSLDYGLVSSLGWSF